jgi:hypothetical protein
MAKYKITDNASGKTVTVSGDHSPSEIEAEQIFRDAGLRQSPTASGNGQPQQGDNPLMYGAAKAQEFLSKGQSLPIIGSMLGKVTTGGSSVGTGFGASVGSLASSQLKPENAGLRQPKLTDLIGINNPMSQGLTPINKPFQNEDITNAGKTGLTYGVLDKIVTGGSAKASPIFQPFKYRANVAAQNAAKTGTKMSGDVLIKAGEDFAKNEATPDILPSVNKFIETSKEMYAGKEFTLPQLLEKLAGFNHAYKATGEVANAGSSQYKAALARAVRQYAYKQGPEVVFAMKNYALSKGARAMARKLIWPIAIGAGTGLTFAALQRVGLGNSSR